MSYSLHDVWPSDTHEPTSDVTPHLPPMQTSARVADTDTKDLVVESLQREETIPLENREKTIPSEKREIRMLIAFLVLGALVINHLDRLHSRIRKLERAVGV